MLPSSLTCDAPVASKANFGLESWFAVSFTAPLILAPFRVGLEITILTPCVGQICSRVRKRSVSPEI
jgi:hypothetical protein